MGRTVHNELADALLPETEEKCGLRRFASLNLSEPIPDETTILNFRHMLEEYYWTFTNGPLLRCRCSLTMRLCALTVDWRDNENARRAVNCSITRGSFVSCALRSHSQT